MIPKTCKHCGGNVSEERDIGTSYFACDKCGYSYGSKPNNEKPGKHLKKGDDDLYYSVQKRKQPVSKSQKYTSVAFPKSEKPTYKRTIGKYRKNIDKKILSDYKKRQTKFDLAYASTSKKIGSQISYKSPHDVATKIIGMNIPKPMWVHDNKKVERRIQMKSNSKKYVTEVVKHHKKPYTGVVDDLFKNDKTTTYKRTQPTIKKRRCIK